MRKINYALNNYKTEECGNLYAPIVERSSALTKMPSHLGMIVPVSIVSIDGFEPLRKTLLNQNAIAHFLNFGVFPSKLFEGVAQRLTILLLSPSNGENKIYTSPYRRWLEAERSTLFETSDYAEISNIPIGKIIPKTGKIGVDIRSNVNTISACVSQVITTLSVHMLYYHRSPNNFIRSHCALPFYRGAGGENISKDHMRILTIDNQKNRNVIVGLLMSSLFFWHWEAHGNCRNVTDDDIRKFPLNISHKLQTSLCSMVTSLMDDMGRHAKRKVRHQKKTGDVLYDEYYVKESKPILDAIDRVLAEHYGFTEEELDFIINYDIKYRMGAALNEEE
jgi:hypothetical protein